MNRKHITPNRIVSLILISAVLAFSLTACGFGSKELLPVGIDEKTAACFKDCMTVDEIIKDVRTVDFYLEPDFSGLSVETVEDRENDTKDLMYKDGKGNTVYVMHEGYGEDCFDYYTKSASGRELKVDYENDVNISGNVPRLRVWITCDDYNIGYSQLDRNEKYGAKEVYVSIKKNSGYPLSEVLSVSYQDGCWGLPEALFCDEEGYEYYCSWEETGEDGSVEIKSNQRPIHERTEKAPECNTGILQDELIDSVPVFVFGHHKLSYLDNPNGQWYLTADFILTFSTEEDRDAFKAKYGIEESVSLGNEDDYITLHTGEITVPVSKDFEDFEWLAGAWEVDDPYYKAVKFNGNMELVSIFNTGKFSLY